MFHRDGMEFFLESDWVGMFTDRSRILGAGEPLPAAALGHLYRAGMLRDALESLYGTQSLTYASDSLRYGVLSCGVSGTCTAGAVCCSMTGDLAGGGCGERIEFSRTKAWCTRSLCLELLKMLHLVRSHVAEEAGDANDFPIARCAVVGMAVCSLRANNAAEVHRYVGELQEMGAESRSYAERAITSGLMASLCVLEHKFELAMQVRRVLYSSIFSYILHFRQLPYYPVHSFVDIVPCQGLLTCCCGGLGGGPRLGRTRYWLGHTGCGQLHV